MYYYLLLFFAAILIVAVLIALRLSLRGAIDITLTVTTGVITMIVDKEFDILEGQTATLKLRPIDNVGGDSKVENVDFSVDNPEIGQLGVNPNDPLMFALVIPLGVSGDLTLNLSADGHLGEGVTQISKSYICHIKSKDAVDVQLNVSIDQDTPPPPPPAPTA